MSEDIIVIAMDDRIAWHRNEIEAIEKMKAEHIARTGAKIRNKPGPAKGYKKQNGQAPVEVIPKDPADALEDSGN